MTKFVQFFKKLQRNRFELDQNSHRFEHMKQMDCLSLKQPYKNEQKIKFDTLSLRRTKAHVARFSLSMKRH